MDGHERLRLRVLGDLTATRDGVGVDLGGRRQRAVLAALIVVHGQAVSSERLIDCVWGDHPPADGTAAIQAYISHLRRRLEPDAGARQRGGVIASSGAGYTLRLPRESVDAYRFEQAVDSAAALEPRDAVRALDDALALWRGAPYGEYAGQPWVEAESVRLTELRAVARERRLEARLQLGEAALLVGEFEALIAEDPLREERWRLLALALYRAHRQADALAALRRARATLADELGIDPGPALRALEADLLAQSPALDAPIPSPRPVVAVRDGAAAAEAEPSTAAATVKTREPASDLVERGQETTALRRAVDEVNTGTSGCVLVEGPAGIGKSRLLVEATRLATGSGARVMSARGSQLEQSFGFGAVRQLFEPALAGPESNALLQGAAARASGVFDAIADDGPGEQGGFAVLHGLYWLTVNLAASGPLVLVVDDVQWCDSASLRYLAYLVKRLDALPVLVVLGLRTGEALAEDALLSEIALDPATIVLRPSPLSADAARGLVRERLGEAADAFVDTCHRMTSGNPLLLRQLLRALEDAGISPDVSHVDTVRAVGSRAVSALVTMRLRRLPTEAVAAARAVAVLGDTADLPTVAALAGRPEAEVAAALDALSRREILSNDDLCFVHPLIREAVYGDLPAGERALDHERAAGILHRRGAPVEQVAAHLLRSPRRGSADAVEVLRTAARTALARGAAEPALLMLRRALAEPPSQDERPALLDELGEVEVSVEGRAAVEHLTEAYGLLQDACERARIAVIIARTHAFVSPPGVATAFAREAADALPADLDDARQGLIALLRLTGYMHGLPESSYRSGPAPEVSGDGDGARMLAATLSYELLRVGKDRERAVALARFALAGDRLVAVDTGLLWVVGAVVLLLADEDIGDFWDRVLARAYATGGMFAALSVNLWRGFTEWRYGQLDDALQSLTDAVEQHRMWGSSEVTVTYSAAFTLGVHVDRGDLDAGEAALAEARTLPWVGDGGRLMRDSAARLHLAAGRAEEALAELTAPIPAGDVTNPAWAPWRGLKAQALAGLGRRDEALVLADEEVTLLRQWGAPTALGISLRIRGEIGGSAGVADLREAVALLSETRASLDAARARVALARAPGIADAEAVPLLQAALTEARACGARSVAADAAAELAQRGHAEAEAGGGPTRLTRRQRRVSELTAAGLTAEEVAQRLFLTPGTVLAALEATRSAAR